MGKAGFKAEYVASYMAMDQLPKDGRPQIAIAGRSNVGKSSLLNRMLGQRHLAKVSSTPGKTRALNFFLVSDKYYIVDLPGYGYAKVEKTLKASWGKLMAQYLNGSENLVGLLLLLDARRNPTPEDLELRDWLAKRQLPVMVVVTKVDKVNRDQRNRKVRQVEEELGVSALPFSSVTGEGKPELIASLLDLVQTSRVE